MNEKELRDWIWAHRKTWTSLVGPLPDFVLAKPKLDVCTFGPAEILWEILRERIVRSHHLVSGLTLLGKEVQIAQGPGRMYMDLFGIPYELGAPGLCVIELKVGSEASRQSFTELLGYGNGLALHFPGLCREDLVHVLVAPMANAPTIVRHAIAAFMVMDKRPILVLEPALDSSENVNLVPWIPDLSTLGLLGRSVFRKRNFDVAQYVWDNDDDWWCESLLGAVATSAALHMEGSGIHGFAYCTQSFPDAKVPLPNMLVCAGLNPFKVAASLQGILLEDASQASGSDVSCNSNGLGGLKLSDFIHSLRKSEEAGSLADDFESVSNEWHCHLAEIASKTVRRATLRSDGGHVMKDSGFTDFSQLANHLAEDIWVSRTPVLPTGRVREMYEISVECDYRELHKNDGLHPLHGDIYRYAAETLGAHSFFRHFLQRMVAEPGQIAGLVD